MTAVMATLVATLWTVPTSDTYVDGSATYYASGLMEQVVANRGMSLAGYRGGVALNRAGDLGRTVWLEWPDAPLMMEGPYLVVDCAQRGHYQDRLKARYVVEVDAGVAEAHGFFGVGPQPVRVWFVPIPEAVE